MIKSLINLLAASASFLALLLVANTALATPQITNSVVQTLAQPIIEQVSLNLLSPSLQLSAGQSNSISEYFGCSCAACSQAARDSKIDI
jgi:hypothetical protein